MNVTLRYFSYPSTRQDFNRLSCYPFFLYLLHIFLNGFVLERRLFGLIRLRFIHALIARESFISKPLEAKTEEKRQKRTNGEMKLHWKTGIIESG